MAKAMNFIKTKIARTGNISKKKHSQKGNVFGMSCTSLGILLIKMTILFLKRFLDCQCAVQVAI